MAIGRVLLGSLLLLSLQLGLGGDPGTPGAPVVEGTLSSELAADIGTWKAQLGKDPQHPVSPQLLPGQPLTAVNCPLSPPRCPPAPSPGWPMPAAELGPASGGAGPGLCFGGDDHLPLLCWQLSPRCPLPTQPDAGLAAEPGPSTWKPLLPAHPLC